MTGAHKAPGALSASDTWKAIPWHSVDRQVKRLQMRIAKAEKARRFGKVRALQRLLTRSHFGKLWAVRRVVVNKGRRTPGVDGVLWKTPEERLQAVRSLGVRGYRPEPLRRIYIEKKNGKLRPLSIPTMKDRAMQALFLLALNPIAEVRADLNSYGFRPHRSTADALGQCFNVLAKKISPIVVFEADIKACFDRISHAWLLANIPMDKEVLRKWLAAGYVENTVLYPTQEGTPQGGIISPVLANLTLDGLERVAREAVPSRSLVNTVRYADDFITTARTPEQLHEKIIPAISAFLAERGLELSAEKSKVTDVNTGFDFLGVTLRKYRGKLLMKPARKSVLGFLKGIRLAIKARPHSSVADLIRLLNPRIRGWANYYRHLVSSRVFSRVDRAIFHALTRWIRRRHSGISLQRLWPQYFRRRENRASVFFAATRKPNGAVSYLDLFEAHSLRITRHIKVRGEATAFDPEHQDYFRLRRVVQKRADERGLLGFGEGASRSPRPRRSQPGRVKAAHGRA